MYKTAAHEFYAEMVDELGKAAATQALQAGKKLPAVPSYPEVMALFEVAKIPRDRLILRLFYSCGARVSEMVGFNCCDIFFDTGLGFVRSGKNDTDRYICIDPETLSMLKVWQKDRAPATSLFGLTSRRQVNRIVVDCGRKTGIVDKYAAMDRSFSPHSLRHAWATHLFENGADLFTIQKLLGHQYLTTTLMYVHVGMTQARHVYLKTHPLVTGGVVDPAHRPLGVTMAHGLTDVPPEEANSWTWPLEQFPELKELLDKKGRRKRR